MPQAMLLYSALQLCIMQLPSGLHPVCNLATSSPQEGSHGSTLITSTSSTFCTPNQEAGLNVQQVAFLVKRTSKQQGPKWMKQTLLERMK